MVDEGEDGGVHDRTTTIKMCNQVENKHCNAFWNPIRFHNLKLFGIVSAFFLLFCHEKILKKEFTLNKKSSAINKAKEGERERRTRTRGH